MYLAARGWKRELHRFCAAVMIKEHFCNLHTPWLCSSSSCVLVLFFGLKSLNVLFSTRLSLPCRSLFKCLYSGTFASSIREFVADVYHSNQETTQGGCAKNWKVVFTSLHSKWHVYCICLMLINNFLFFSSLAKALSAMRNA